MSSLRCGPWLGSWVLFISLGLVPAASANEAAPAIGPNVADPERPETSTDDGPPEILLTFDDGPALDKTPRVLDVLDEYGVKVVFFVNGWRFAGNREKDEKARELLREMIRRGHYVANHTVHHHFLCGKVYSRRAAEEIEHNAALIEAAVGIRPELYRTPYGAHCRSLSKTHDMLGIRSTGWDIDPQDWRLRDSKKIRAYMERALRRLKGRKIVLFHDVHSATVDALPRLLEWIRVENGQRIARGDVPIKLIDYRYLLRQRPLIPPMLDALGRLLVGTFAAVSVSPPVRLPQLAWLPPGV